MGVAGEARATDVETRACQSKRTSEPGDYVNVAHGSATDASSLLVPIFMYPNPNDIYTATLPKILFRSAKFLTNSRVCREHVNTMAKSAIVPLVMRE